MNTSAPVAPADTIKDTMKRAGCPLSIDQQMVLAGSLAVYDEKDHIQDQLCARIEELQADKDELIRQLDQVEAENARMRDAIRRARIYAGDNLPAAPGLTVVGMLEDALREGAR